MRPTTIYGNSKVICSQIAQELCKACGIGYSWIRIFTLYGPDDNHDWLIPFVIKKMLNNEPVTVTKCEQKWDYLYIDDAVDFFIKLIDKNGIGVVNLGSGEFIQLRDNISNIKQFIQSNSVVNFGVIPYRPDQVMHLEANIEKIKKCIGWSSKVNLETGILNTVEWLKNNAINAKYPILKNES